MVLLVWHLFVFTPSRLEIIPEATPTANFYQQTKQAAARNSAIISSQRYRLALR